MLHDAAFLLSSASLRLGYALIIGLGGVAGAGTIWRLRHYREHWRRRRWSISVTFPGQTPRCLEDPTSTSHRAKKLNGVEGFAVTARRRAGLTQCASYRPDVLSPGRNIDNAQMECQNRLSRVTSALPEEVAASGCSGQSGLFHSDDRRA